MCGSRCDGACDERLRDEQQRAFAVNAFALVALVSLVSLFSLIALITGFIRQRIFVRISGLEWLDFDFIGGQSRKRLSGRR